MWYRPADPAIWFRISMFSSHQKALRAHFLTRTGLLGQTTVSFINATELCSSGEYEPGGKLPILYNV